MSKKISVLIGCEKSGVVRDAFLKYGCDKIEVLSCDFQDTEKNGPHYKGDIFDLLYYPWTMVILHPPCTHLAVSGAKHFEKKKLDGRYYQGVSFFMKLVKATNKFSFRCIENPIGIMSSIWTKPTQIIQPWQFGDSFQKSTCLWLKNLPCLEPTRIVNKGKFVTTPSGKKLPEWYSNNTDSDFRGKTFSGIADAMSLQWISYLERKGIYK